MPRKLLAMLILATTLLGAGLAGHEPAARSSSAAQVVDPRGVSPTSPNPLAGLNLFVDRESPSWLSWQSYTRRGQSRQAALVWKIAREPKNIWVGRFTRPNFIAKHYTSLGEGHESRQMRHESKRIRTSGPPAFSSCRFVSIRGRH